MLIDISVVPGLSYFGRPRRDFSLLLVKPEIIVIQMFIYSYCCKRGKIGWEASTTLLRCRFSVFCYHYRNKNELNLSLCPEFKKKLILLSEMDYGPTLCLFLFVAYRTTCCFVILVTGVSTWSAAIRL